MTEQHQPPGIIGLFLHDVEGRADLLVVCREVSNIAERLALSQASAVAAQVQRVEPGASTRPVLCETLLKEIVRPSVHVQHVDVFEHAPLLKQSATPGQVADECGDRCAINALDFGSQRDRLLLVPITEDVGLPPRIHASNLATRVAGQG